MSPTVFIESLLRPTATGMRHNGLFITFGKILANEHSIIWLLMILSNIALIARKHWIFWGTIFFVGFCLNRHVDGTFLPPFAENSWEPYSIKLT